jgi:hypothetical protein
LILISPALISGIDEASSGFKNQKDESWPPPLFFEPARERQ